MLKAYYGDLREFGSWTADEFTLTTGATFRAIGALESPRGTRKDAVRPDTALVDDFDTDADCRNPDILKKKWEWFEEALFPTRSISEDLLVIFCGNLIALDCCVKRAGDKADHWDIVNIRDKDGKSSWPEKNTEERINRIQSKISTKAFQQEYMNNPFPRVTRSKKWYGANARHSQSCSLPLFTGIRLRPTQRTRPPLSKPVSLSGIMTVNSTFTPVILTMW